MFRTHLLWACAIALTACDGELAGGGTLAYSGVDNIVLVPSGSGDGEGRPPHYTKDRGATWQPIDLGVPWTLERARGIHNAFFLNRQIVAADPEALGTFYLFSASADASLRGLWVSEDGGDSWSRGYEGYPAPGPWAFNAMMEVPVSGHVWITAGGESPNGEAGSPAFLRSTDGGETFEAVPRTREVVAFGFGAPAPNGSGYPTLFIDGYVDGVHGTWVSPNADAPEPAWIWLADYPAGLSHTPRAMAGDPDHAGRVWMGLGCAGGAYGDFSALL